jgi:membrane-associated phospholipid phosphatase
MFGDVNQLARQTTWLHEPVLAYASYGVVLFGLILLASWWLARDIGPRAVAASVWAGAATLLAVAANQPLVQAFQEARPYTAHRGILVLASRSADYSFPSDHAVMAGAVAVGAWLVDRRLGIIATVLAVLMAFARVYIAAHYPHDVLAGLAFGGVITLLGWLLVAAPLTWLVTRLAATRLRPLVTARETTTECARG